LVEGFAFVVGNDVQTAVCPGFEGVRNILEQSLLEFVCETTPRGRFAVASQNRYRKQGNDKDFVFVCVIRG
jgi:hypothetical protein